MLLLEMVGLLVVLSPGAAGATLTPVERGPGAAAAAFARLAQRVVVEVVVVVAEVQEEAGMGREVRQALTGPGLGPEVVTVVIAVEVAVEVTVEVAVEVAARVAVALLRRIPNGAQRGVKMALV